MFVYVTVAFRALVCDLLLNSVTSGDFVANLSAFCCYSAVYDKEIVMPKYNFISFIHFIDINVNK